jgi:tetratricopeptide (TPR) repeat protein
MAAQQPHLAIREFERMAAVPPQRPDAFLMLCSAYAKMYENGRAAEVARRGLGQFPDNPDLLARRAMLLIMADNRVAGAELCRHWLQKQPDAAEPYRLLGSIARTELRHTEAVRLCEQAMEREPQNPEYCRETARALMGNPTAENQQRAADVLRRAIRLDPRNGEARLQLADVLQRQGELEAAREQYLRGMDCSPADRRGVVGLSQLCARLGKPGRMGLFGGIVRTLHDREDAARGLWRRVFLNPNDADAHARLAALLLDATDLDQARFQLAQTVALRPNQEKEKRQLQVVERLLAQQEQ